MARKKTQKEEVPQTQVEEVKKPSRRGSKKVAEAVAKVTEEKIEVTEEKSEVVEVAEEKVEAIEEKVEVAEENASEVAETSEKSEAPASDNIPRYDVMITSEGAGYKPPKVAFGNMVQQIALRGLAKPVDEAIAETWIEVYFEPDYAAHDIFLEKGYFGKEPVFKELVLRVQDKPFFCDFSPTPKRPLYWCIEIRGSRFREPIGAFKKLFLEAFHVRIAVCSHEAGPMPEHRIVPEEEKPVEKKRRERGAGIVGLEIEES